MALEKQTAIDKIEVLENGSIQVREIVRIVEDGNELSASYNRWSLNPLDDVSTQNAKVQAIANAVWTDEVKTSYRTMIEAQQVKLGAQHDNDYASSISNITAFALECLMSDTEKDLAVHVAVCDERYKNIADMLKEGDRRMTKIEYLIYAVMALVMFGPGVAAQFFHKFFGI